ncbi:hypothetical protein [Tautonia rosea]|uniref:hypothetical protein n=1 Tax=Tautonia rosea TaxID=2728037 RepID=UPI001474FC24|nr:hypothetical protein [Tautonia rosea]
MTRTWQRAWLLAAGLGSSILWFACWAASVVPGTSAVTVPWALGNLEAVLTGATIGAAWMCRSHA